MKCRNCQNPVSAFMSFGAMPIANDFLITDNFMGDHATFATVQVNMTRRRMACWIFQQNEIVTLFEKNNYRLQYKSTNYQPWNHINNFPVEYRIKDSCNLLFEKLD